MPARAWSNARLHKWNAIEKGVKQTNKQTNTESIIEEILLKFKFSDRYIGPADDSATV